MKIKRHFLFLFIVVGLLSIAFAVPTFSYDKIAQDGSNVLVENTEQPANDDIKEEIASYEVKSYYDYINSNFSPEAAYTRIEYLKSTRSQYIDTGFCPTNTTEIRANIKFDNFDTNYRSNPYIFGVTDAENKKVFSVNFGADVAQKDRFLFWTNVGNSNGDGVRFLDNVDKLTAKNQITFKSGLATYAGESTALYTSSWDKIDYSIYIFAINASGQAKLMESKEMYVYDFQIYDNGELVRNYIPCYRNSDKVTGLYDLVEKKFYTSATKTEFDFVDKYNPLVGSGTQEDPYKISSATELAYCAYRTKTWGFSQNKYFELTNDIVLNDENIKGQNDFSGGDGIVYEWDNSFGQYASSSGERFCGHFDGKGYSISGLYSTTTNLFGEIQNASIKNLNVNNSYVFVPKPSNNTQSNCGGIARRMFSNSVIDSCKVDAHVEGSGYNVGGITGAIVSTNCGIYNCVAKGTVKGLVQVGGIIGHTENTSMNYERNDIKNCENYAKVTVTSTVAGGIIGNPQKIRITYCDNYGEVNAESSSDWACGGIAGQVRSIAYVKHCNNYGDVTTPGGNTGGIVGIMIYGAGLHGSVEYCKNYGKITAKGTNVAGICGIQGGMIDFIGCENYGEIINTTSTIGSGIIGQISSSEQTAKTNIIDCHIRSKYSSYFCYSVGPTDGFVNIANCSANYFGTTKTLNEIVRLGRGDISIKNFVVNFDGQNVTGPSLFVMATTIAKVKVDVKNCVLNINSKHFNGLYRGVSGSNLDESSIIDGIVIDAKVNNVTKKQYAGSDFSGLYTSWKTGKIGLKALDGVGFYQGEVNEQVLSRKGYSKLAV